jgi:cytochrome c556
MRAAAALLALVAIVSPASQPPAGWKMRVDRSSSASDPDAPGPIKFVAAGTGFHATNPQAAIFWNSASTISGSYSVTGTFTLLEPSNHTNYYGLIFGGRDLDGAAQRYIYFLVAQDGTWLVKRRDGDVTTQTLLAKTASKAVKTPDGSGRSTNTLEARITPDAIAFTINGTTVATWLGAARAIETDGIYGIRVNHFLDVEADRLAATPLASSTSSPSADDVARRAASETIAITGPVRRVLSRTAFSIGQPDGRDAIVLAPELQRTVDTNAMVTAFGRGGDTRELPADVAARSDGRSAVLATSVLTAAMVDLTKPVPPPATAEEEALDGIMKRVAPAFSAVRQAIDGSDSASAGQQASTLQQAFTEVEAFWARQARADAVNWARTARLQSESIGRAAAGADWASAKTSVNTLGQQCQACHGVYRQAFDDGSFRIKKPRP